ncbi:GDCCVxC domain-containing (seleno)protein [Fodinibius sp. SL11]|uniref:GDCCVxC domain-containing (seleno)protein n=1 Tax=Fodinibius sp. SL11 TaxID=3425690 RepID=UPI003F8845D0
MNNTDRKIKLQSTITCPNCGHESTETMPTDSCQYFWECSNCGEILKPQKRDCCVFCSYGDIPCPPVQKEKSCC